MSSSVLKTVPLRDTPAVSPRGRLLVVDDVFENRNLLSRYLKRRGFDIVEACDGEEALRLMDRDDFDLVLLDVMMPGIGGMETLRRIREARSADLLPVVMVTAKAMSEDVVEALGFGANDYVTKPLDLPVVLARVETQVERRRAAQAAEDAKLDLAHDKEDLELSLAERNAKLAKANAQLRDEIARRVAADERSTYLAYHDALTGLANRHACDERLPELLRAARAQGHCLAVLFLDLDGFKNVNDALGHAVGDALIKDVAETMREVIGARDHLVRLGGDEFCIIHDVEEAVAETSGASLAQRLLDAICRGRHVEGHQVHIGVSIGLAFDCATVERADELLKRADVAMYRAKSEGRGVWRRFHDDMDREIQDRRLLELDLRNALLHGEFELHYQPIVDLRSNELSGFEALLRWDRNGEGLIPPDRFIPLAEETGLILQIGEWVLRRACEEASTWPPGLRIAVNVSSLQFRSRRLLSTVVNALASTGLAATRLELELTETALLCNSADTLGVLKQLRELGVRLSMDDFGTGYSSLSYFRTFQFDKVKIDRSFVSGCAAEGNGRAIVRAVVGLGDSFGVTTTAEGVETEEQLAYLRDEGCQEVQGFLFGAGLTAAAAKVIIARYAARPPSAEQPIMIREGDTQ